MTSQDTQYAYLEGTNEIVHVNSVTNGNRCGCVCIGCGKPLIAKNNGLKNISHFSHLFQDNKCSGGEETILHLLTKNVIKDFSSVFLPLVLATSNIHEKLYGKYLSENLNINKSFFNEIVKIKNIELEKKEGEIKPDITAEIEHDGENHKIFIEIKVTHEVNEKKIKILKDNKQNCIEIDINLIRKNIKNLNLDEIKKEIISFLFKNKNISSYVKWINQNIIDIEKEIKKLNDQIYKNSIKERKKEIFNVFKEINELNVKCLCSGKLKNVKILEIINVDYKLLELECLFLIDDQKINGFLVLLENKQESTEIKDKKILISVDTFPYIKDKTKKVFLNHIIKHKKTKITALFESFNIKEKTMSDYKNDLFESLKERFVFFPNTCFYVNEVSYKKNGLKTFLEIPLQMQKGTHGIKIEKVNYLNVYKKDIIEIHSKNKIFYLVFTNNFSKIKKDQNILKLLKEKKSIICFHEKEIKQMIKSSHWALFEYEWIYHKGFELLIDSYFKLSNIKDENGLKRICLRKKWSPKLKGYFFLSQEKY